MRRSANTGSDCSSGDVEYRIITYHCHAADQSRVQALTRSSASLETEINSVGLSSCASVLMMETTYMRNGHDISLLRRFN